FFPCLVATQYKDHLHPHSHPTRRSSDLLLHRRLRDRGDCGARSIRGHRILVRIGLIVLGLRTRVAAALPVAAVVTARGPIAPMRSEEHTSELQSRFDLVCRLLLEKQKKK